MLYFKDSGGNKMTGLSNMMCWHVVIYDNSKKKGNVLLQQKCFTVDEANKLLAAKKEEFPKPGYTVTKERF